MIGIYKITNNVNGKVYIGQSVDINKRLLNHKSAAFNPNEKSYEYPLYRAMRKYGLENFSFDLLEECSIKELDAKEKLYIANYKSHGPMGYNQDDGGFSSHNFKLTDDDVSEIIHRLKTTDDALRFIGEDFGVSETAIRRINRGAARRRENEEYPIRNDTLSAVINRFEENGTNNNAIDAPNRCYSCGRVVSVSFATCKECSYVLQRKVADRPSPIELAKMIKETSFSEVGRNFGVDSNTIKKWCKIYQIPYKLKELIAWYNEQMGIVDPPKPVKRKMEDMIHPVKQIDIHSNEVVAVFESYKAAARSLIEQGHEAKITTIVTSIGRAISGKLKTAYGYRWECA